MHVLCLVALANCVYTVVWNPWSEKAKAMSDFGDDEVYNIIIITGHKSTVFPSPHCTVYRYALCGGWLCEPAIYSASWTDLHCLADTSHSVKL